MENKPTMPQRAKTSDYQTVADLTVQLDSAEDLINFMYDTLKAVFEETAGTGALSDEIDSMLERSVHMVDHYRKLAGIDDSADHSFLHEVYDDDDMGDD